MRMIFQGSKKYKEVKEFCGKGQWFWLNESRENYELKYSEPNLIPVLDDKAFSATIIVTYIDHRSHFLKQMHYQTRNLIISLKPE